MGDWLDNFVLMTYTTPMFLYGWTGLLFIIWLVFGLYDILGLYSIIIQIILTVVPSVLLLYHIDKKESREQVEIQDIEDRILQKSQWWKK